MSSVARVLGIVVINSLVVLCMAVVAKSAGRWADERSGQGTVVLLPVGGKTIGITVAAVAMVTAVEAILDLRGAISKSLALALYTPTSLSAGLALLVGPLRPNLTWPAVLPRLLAVIVVGFGLAGAAVARTDGQRHAVALLSTGLWSGLVAGFMFLLVVNVRRRVS